MDTDGEAAARVSRRKLEHLELALNGGVEGPTGPGWEDVCLIHDCLPEIDLGDVELTTDFLGHALRAPLWITGMTGGHQRAGVINARLAVAAERHGLAMGLGSQRAGLSTESLMASYQSAREAAPSAILLANIGAPQLIAQDGHPALTIRDLQRIIDSISAQGLAIHLNFLQEMVQPEGDRNARGCLAAIGEVAAALDVPVLAKETGAGISRQRAVSLRGAGMAAIDVGGAGGTSMVRIEGARARQNQHSRAPYAQTFEGWGIPTAASVLEARDCGVPVIATGGIRSGLDAAKALALGAHAVGVGLPFLTAANESEAALDEAIGQFLGELRVALFLSGSASPAEIAAQGAVLFGNLRAWAMQRGLLAE